ncbi:N-acetyl sugar amidotransferase [Alphaproteobacteria bacterium]|nr:N-acetyl sugar amidotransferase [Alphaproteobacteria bacterium]
MTSEIICKHCVMDTSDRDIKFNSHGVCNHCNEFFKKQQGFSFTEEQEQRNLVELKNRLRARKKGPYDCILGVSGGVDSSYLAFLAMELDLNPLLMHFDNGWNSSIAVKNVRNIVQKTGFDLHTFVIDWAEFRDLQLSFIRAGVVDIEMITDHAIFASMFKIRKKFGISSILSGTNYLTEHGMPRSWSWQKLDIVNIRSIHNRWGAVKLKEYPTIPGSLWWEVATRYGFAGQFEEPLNLINYRKEDAMGTLARVFNWEYYGGKHYESIFTKFYQGYILPEKFNIDKRKMHLSAQVRIGEITRDSAIDQLNEPLYRPNELRRDKVFFLKKLGLTEDEFKSIMAQEPVNHSQYSTEMVYLKPILKIAKIIRLKR